MSFSVFLLLAFVFTCAYVTHAEKIGPEEIRSIYQENGVVHYRNGLNLDKAVGKKGSYNFKGGELNVWGKIESKSKNGLFNWTSGVLKTDRINFDLINRGSGRLSPGHSPGVLIVSGNYTSSSASDLYMELAGTSNVSPVKYDKLIVLKKYTIKGSLTVVLIDGFQPQEGQSFDLMDWNTKVGTFQTISLPALGDGLYWVTSNLYVNGTISVAHIDRDRDGVPNWKDYFPDDGTKVSAIPSGLSSLSGNLFAWYNAGDKRAVSTTNLNVVNALYDFSGNDRHLYQSNSLYQPSYSLFQNNLFGISFSGTKFLTSTAFSSILPQSYTLVFMAKRTTTTQGSVLIDGISSADSLTFSASSGAYQINAGAALSGGALQTVSEVVTIVVSGSSSEIYVDGKLVAQGDAGSNSLSGLTLGANYLGANGFTGSFGEMVVLNKVLNLTERKDVEKYLGNKWLVTKTADRDNDGVRDYDDAYPVNALKTTANITILSPQNYQSFRYNTSSVLVTVSMNIPESYDGYGAFTINDSFVTANFISKGTTFTAKSLVTFNRLVSTNSTYAFTVGLVSSRNQILTSSLTREVRYIIEGRTYSGYLPNSISGLKIWYDVYDTATLTKPSDIVSAWADKSGNASNSTQSTSTKRPNYVTSIINGEAVLHFPGVDDFLSVPYVLGDLNSNSYTIFLVGKSNVTNPGAAGYFLSTQTPQQINLYQNTNNNLMAAYGGAPIILDSGVSAVNPFIAMMDYDGTTDLASLVINNASSKTGTIGYTGTPTAMTLGSFNAGASGFLNGYIGEVVVFNRILDSTDKTKMFQYLSWKWGIALQVNTTPISIIDTYLIDYGASITRTTLLNASTRNIEIARQDVGTLTLGAGGSAQSISTVLGGKQATQGNLVLTGSNASFLSYKNLTLGESGNSLLNLQSGVVSVNGTIYVASQNTSVSAINFSGGILRVPALRKGAGKFVFNWTGGQLRSPLIATSITNNGGVLDVRGATQISGDYVQSNGTLALDIFSLANVEKLSVTGKFIFGGTLNVTVSNNYSFKVGQSFDILDFASSSGSFAKIKLPALSAYVTWDVSLLPVTGVIKVINQVLDPLLDEDNDGVPNGKDRYPTWNYRVDDFPSELLTFESKIKLWMDASTANAVSLDGSDGVQVWYDRSGKKNHFNQTVSAPAYVTALSNGKSGIRFNQALSTYLSGSGNLANAYPVTVFIVASANTQKGTLFSLEDKDVNDVYYSVGVNGTGEFDMSISNTTLSSVSTGRIAPSKPRVLRFELNSNTDKQLVVQGGKFASLGSSVLLNSNLDSFTLGRLGTSTVDLDSYADVDLFEILVVTGSITIAQDRAIEAYLQTKWIGSLDSDDDGYPDSKDAYIYDTTRTTCNVAIIAPAANTLYPSNTTSVTFQVTHNVGADFNGYLAYTVTIPFSKTNIVLKRTTVNIGTPATFVVPVQSNNSYTVYVGLVDRSHNIITSCNIRYLTFSVSASIPDFEPQMRITDGLQLWLDANDPLDNGSKPNSGILLSVWKDKSGNSRHAYASDFNRPTYVQSVVNGRPIVRFDGVNDKMTGASGAYKTVIGVLNVSAVPNTYGMVFAKANDLDLSLRYVTNGLLTSATSSDWQNGLTNKVYMNGTQTSLINRSLYHVVYSERNASDSFAYSLSSEFSSRRFQGDIAELLVYNKALSTTEREEVENYLATKWNIVSKNLELIPVYSIDAYKTETYTELKNVVSRNLQVGADSQGALILNEGGNFKNKNSILGGKKGSIGNVQINTSTSYWLNDGDLYVGNYGSGIVEQSAGFVTVNLNLKIAASLNSTGSYTLSGGELKVGVLEKAKGNSTWLWSGGVLRPTTVSFNLTNNLGTLRVENPTTIKGSYTQSGSGILLVDITSAANYKKLKVNGAFSMGGTLQIDLKNGYTGVAGDTFDILDFATSSNAFSTIILPTLGTNLMWDIKQLYKTGVVSIQYAGPVDLDSDGVYDHLDAFLQNSLRSTANISILSPVSGKEYNPGTTVVPVVVTVNVSSTFNGYLAYTINKLFTAENVLSSRTTLNAETGKRITVNIQTINNTGYTIRFGLVNRPVNSIVTTTNVRTVVFSVNDVSIRELVTKNNTQLVVWLDGADIDGSGVLPASGTTMSSWKDKSYYGRSAMQSVSTKKPTFIVDSNSRKVVRFDGTNDNLVMSNDSTMSVANAFTIFIIDKNTGSAKNALNYVLSKGNTAYGVAVTDLATKVMFEKQGSPYVYSQVVTANGLKQFNIKTILQSSGMTKLAINGEIQNPTVAAATFANSVDGLVIGANSSQSASFYDGDIAEILIYNYAVPTAHRELIQNFLASKWNIAAKDLLPEVDGTDYVVDDEKIVTLVGNLQISTCDIRLGKNSAGTIVANSGANILSRSGLLGAAAYSTGITFMNSGSKWIIPTNLQVGGFGMGYVTQNGGVVSVNIALVFAKETGSYGKYALQSGTLNVKEISKGLGTTLFNFTGGMLRAEKVSMPLVNNGGVLEPNPLTTFTSSYTQSSGQMYIGLRSATSYDKVKVGSLFSAGGTLKVAFENGYFPVANTSYDILDFVTTANQFTQILLPSLNEYVTWNVSALYKTGIISVRPFDTDGDGVIDSLDAYPYLSTKTTANIVITSPATDTEFLSGKTVVPVGVDVTYPNRFSGYIGYTKNAPFTKANIISTGVSVNMASHVTFNVSTQDDSGYVILVGLIDGKNNPVPTVNTAKVAFSVLAAGDFLDPTAYVIDADEIKTQTGYLNISTRNLRIGYSERGVLNLGANTDFRIRGGILAGRKNTFASLNVTTGTSQWIANEPVILGKSGRGAVVQDSGLVSLNATLTLGSMTGSTGIYQLKGGELRASTINAGVGSASFLWTGGILSPTSIDIPITQTVGTLDVKSKTKASATYTLQNNAVIQFGLRSASKYDRFISSGQIRFGGKLVVNLENGYFPVLGTSFYLFDFVSSQNVFSSISLPVLNDTLSWDVSKLYKTGVIKVATLDTDGDGVVDKFDAYPTNSLKSASTVTFSSPASNFQFEPSVTLVPVGLDIVVPQVFNGYVAYTVNTDMSAEAVLSGKTTANVASRVTINIPVVPNTTYTILATLVKKDTYNPIPTVSVSTRTFSVKRKTADYLLSAANSGLVLRLDASDMFNNGTSPASGTAVSTWQDKSKYAAAALQGSSTKRPNYILENGVARIRFDGTNDNLTISNYSALNLADAFTIFYVAKNLGSAKQYTNYLLNKVNSYGVAIEDLGRTVALDAPRIGYVARASKSVAGVSHIGTIYKSGTVSKVAVDGTYLAPTITNRTLANSVSALILGSNDSQSSSFFDGDIMEVAIFNSALSTEDRQVVQNFLSTKWLISGIDLQPEVLSTTDYVVESGTSQVRSTSLTISTRNLIVGRVGNGTFTLKGASTLTVKQMVLGALGSTIGNLTVASASSTVFSLGTTVIGDAGTGVVSQNAGTVSINTYLKLSNSVGSVGTYYLKSGTLSVDTLMKGNGIGSLVMSGGTLKAKSILYSFENNAGILDVQKTTTISGGYTQNSSGQTTIELRSATDFDKLVVNGNLNASGKLTITLKSGYVPVNGTSFDILDFTTSSNVFNTFDFPVVGATSRWDTSEFSKTGKLNLVYTKNTDWDSDGVRDGWDAYPSDNARSSGNISVISPSNYTLMTIGSTVSQIRVNRQTSVSFNMLPGKIAYTANAPFTKSIIDAGVGAGSQALAVVNTFNVSLSNGFLYTVQMGFVSPNNTPVAAGVAKTWYIAVPDSAVDSTAYKVDSGTVASLASNLVVSTRNLEVGQYFMGTLTIPTTRSLTNKAAILGGIVNATGTVNMTSSGVWNNLDSVTVGRKGFGGINQSAGTVSVNGTLVLAEYIGSMGRYSLTGGTLITKQLSKGSGTATFTWTGGTLKVGTSNMAISNLGGTLDVQAPKTLVNGNYTQSSGIASFEIRSTKNYDKLVVNGVLSSAGTLQITFNGYTPKYDDVFDILDFVSTANKFSTVLLPSLPLTYVWDTTQLYKTGEIKVAFTSVVDSDGDGVSDYFDAYPTTVGKTTPNLTVTLPTSNAYFAYTKRSVSLNVSYVVPISFKGTLAYTLNEPFESGLRTTFNVDNRVTPLLKSIPVTGNGTYIIRVGLINPNGSVVTTASIRTVTIYTDGDFDGDGVGDKKDAYPEDPTRTALSVGQSALDSDNDGVPNLGDKFSTDAAAAIDTDGDGYPNVFFKGYSVLSNGKKLDQYPSDNLDWYDDDLDGVANNLDAFPTNALRSTPNLTIVSPENNEALETGSTLTRAQIMAQVPVRFVGKLAWTINQAFTSGNIKAGRTTRNVSVYPLSTTFNITVDEGVTYNLIVGLVDSVSTKLPTVATRSVVFRVSDVDMVIEGGQTLTLDSALYVTTRNIVLGRTGAGSIVMNSGADLRTVKLSVGKKPSVEGCLLINDGQINLNNLLVADSGIGRVTQNAGVVSINSSMTIGNLVGSQGEYVLAGGELRVPRILSGMGSFSLKLNSGNLKTNFIAASVVNTGATLNIEKSTTVNGTFTQLSSGTLVFKVRSGIDYARLVVASGLTMGGKLKVELDGYSPSTTHILNLIDSATTANSFASVQLPTLTGGYLWDSSKLISKGELRVTRDYGFDSDADGVVDGYDTYPFNPLKSTSNISIVLPTLPAGYSSAVTSFNLRVASVVPAWFTGAIAYSVNSDFNITSNRTVVSFATTKNINIPISSYQNVVTVGLVNLNGSIMASVERRAITVHRTGTLFKVYGVLDGYTESYSAPSYIDLMTEFGTISDSDGLVGVSYPATLNLTSSVSVTMDRLIMSVGSVSSKVLVNTAELFAYSDLIIGQQGASRLVIQDGDVNAGGTLLMAQAAGSSSNVDLKAGTLRVSELSKGLGEARFNWTGGKFSATTVNMNLINTSKGILDLYSKMTVVGNYQQGAQATLNIHLESMGGYGALSVTGLFQRNGALVISFPDGWLPSTSATFNVFETPSVSGAFSTVQLPVLPAGYVWNSSRLITEGILTLKVYLPNADNDGDGVPNARDLYPDDASKIVDVSAELMSARPNMLLWYDSSVSLSVVTDNVGITKWYDLGTKGNHAVQTVSYAKPTYGLATINNKPAILFDENNVLQTQSSVSFNNFTAVVVFKDTGSKESFEPVLSHDLSSGFWIGRQSTVSNLWGSSFKNSNLASGNYFVMPDGAVVGMLLRKNGTSLDNYVNGKKVSTRTVANLASGFNPITIGLQGGVSYTGVIAELIIIDRALTDAEVVSFNSYLYSKWVSKPYFESTGIIDDEIFKFTRTIDLRSNTLQDVKVGYSSSGQLELRDGYQLLNKKTIIGSASSASGNVRLEGTETQWGSEEGLIVGQYGKGRVNQLNGTVVVTGNLIIAEQSGSQGTYSLSGGELNVYGALKKGLGASNFDWSGGTLKFDTVTFNVRNTGTGVLSPGHSPAYAVMGAYYAGPSSTIEMEIAGTSISSPSEYDHIQFNGFVTLNGTLRVVELDDYTFEADTTFDLFDFLAGVTGNFTTIELPWLPIGMKWVTSNIYTTGELSIVYGTVDSDGDGVLDDTDPFPYDSTLKTLPGSTTLGTLPITSGLVLRLDGNRPHGDKSVTSNTRIQTWLDYSGQGFHPEQETVSSRVLYSTSNVFTGFKTIKNDGSRFFLLPNASVLTSHNVFTIFVVGAKASLSGKDYLVSFGADELSVATSANAIMLYQSTNIPKFVNQSTVQTNKSYLFTFTQEVSGFTTIAKTYIRGVQDPTTITFSGAVTAISDANRRLFRNASGNYWDGEVAEILIYNRALTDVERIRVESYLDAKWKLGMSSLNPFMFHAF